MRKLIAALGLLVATGVLTSCIDVEEPHHEYSYSYEPYGWGYGYDEFYHGRHDRD